MNKNLLYLDEVIDGIGIYIHIPFCKQKCRYCNFLSFKGNSTIIKDYISSLKKEIQLYGLFYNKKLKVETIYIGGGTPSYIDYKYIEELLIEVKNNFMVGHSAEITLEVNPGTVNSDKISNYKRMGINRISIGLQSTCDEELNVLGRIHTYEEFEDTYNEFRNKGFDNISIDVMSAIPNQTIDSYKDTLDKVIKLKPNHISSYSLILEENTPFYELRDKLNLVSEDIEREMYYITKKLLGDNGYYRYEISNYAIDNKISKHNNNYWDVTKYYLGLGLGASSYIYEKEYDLDSGKDSENKDVSIRFRYNKIYNMKEYIKIFDEYKDIYQLSLAEILKIKDIIECNKETVSINNQLEEFMFLGLRKIEGVSISKFNSLVEEFQKSRGDKSLDNKKINEQYNDKDMFSIYGDIINKYRDMGMLEIDNDKIYLTDKGIDVCNTIFVDFIGIEL